MKKKISAILAMGLTLSTCLAACGGKTNTPSQNAGADQTDLKGTYDITVWVSESDGVKELTEKQIQDFCKANEGIVINATVEGITEADSATKMCTDVATGADLYCFAQDQLMRLVQAGALNKLGEKAAKEVRDTNCEVGVKAASIGTDVYCYPLTADNTYFMMYDKSVVKEESLGSLEKVIADCEAAGKNFSMEINTSGWYNASFFFATGCHSDWTMNAEGQFTSVDDDFNSDAGLIAMKAMQQVASSKSWVSSSGAADFAAAVPSGAVITGTWGKAAAVEALGDTVAAAPLPKFTVDGKEYQLCAFTGCKLMGVKPQNDAKKTAVLQKLALYLTGEECSMARYNQFGWGPSNSAAQATDAVKNDVCLAAINKQTTGVPQGNIHGSWWDLSKVYAEVAVAKNEDGTMKASEQDMKDALKSYKEQVDALFEKSADELRAFSVIGKFGGYDWDTDVAMKEDPKNTWTAEIEFKAGDEFKVRQGASWDVNFGVDGAAGGANVVIDTDGTYVVTLVYDETAKTATLEVKAK